MQARQPSEGGLSVATRPGLSVIVVTYDSAAEVGRSLPAIAAELRDGDELVVCDNASSDGTPERVAEIAPRAVVHPQGANAGFGAACNAGAAVATNELLLFLNPDAVVAAGFRDAIELPLVEGRGWAAWQGLVTSDGGATVNTWGNDVHFTGIAWAGGVGRPAGEAPRSPREVSFASGACLAVRRSAFTGLGGFSEPLFLYQEDADLSLRLRLAGHRVGIEPRAVCDHDYSFDKGSSKWRYLERNRWAMILRCYPRRLLWLVAPALVATELALHLLAPIGGWGVEKLRADRELVAWLPRLRAERREIQSSARIGAADFAALLTPRLDSPNLGRPGRSRLLAASLGLYWRVVRRLLGRPRAGPAGS